MEASHRNDYLLIGLTGSIGAGKSAVARVFEESGIPVLNADAIAKELMAEDPDMKREIVAGFGEEAYIDGRLNRKHLASRVFDDEEELARLNDIVHPRTIAEQGVRARRLIEEGHRVVACEAALIFETEGENRFDYIVVVDAPEELRFRRAAERDGVPIEEIARRDAMQMPAKRKAEMADFVIRNDGDEEDLRRKTVMIAEIIKMLPPRHDLDLWDDAQEDEEGG